MNSHGPTPCPVNFNKFKTMIQRSLHACVAFENNIYIFGGYDGVNRRNDFYKYNVETNTWSEIKTTENPPSSRDRHVASKTKINLVKWLFN